MTKYPPSCFGNGKSFLPSAFMPAHPPIRSDVFAWCAATVKNCMDATKRLGGSNYVLWGGREGYETC